MTSKNLKIENMIMLSDEISDEIAKEVIGKIIELNIMPISKRPKNIIMFINSCGGKVESMFGILDATRISLIPVVTVCIGKAYSAAIVLLMSGKPGFRFVTENSYLMTHDVTYENKGRVSEHNKFLKEMNKRQDVMCKLMLECSIGKIDSKSLSKFMQSEKFLNADEAIKYGFADRKINSFKEVFELI